MADPQEPQQPIPPISLPEAGKITVIVSGRMDVTSNNPNVVIVRNE